MKLTNEQIKKINENMIVRETEKAIQIKVNLMNRSTGDEKETAIWCPKTCMELSGAGILKMKDWFKKNKENNLKSYITPVLEY